MHGPYIIKLAFFICLCFGVTPTATAGPITEPVGFPLEAVDTDGNLIGVVHLTEDPDDPVVLLQLGSKLFQLEIHPRGFTGSEGNLYFESPNCSGQGYFAPDSPAFYVQSFVHVESSRLFLGRGVPETIMAQSHLDSRQGQDSECILSGYEIIDAVPAVRMLQLDSVFRPPYSIEPVSE